MINKIRQVLQIIPENAAALITKPENTFYITGFVTDAGSLLLSRAGIYFYTDARYYAAASETIDRNFANEFGADVPVVTLIEKNYHEVLNKRFKEDGITEVFIESKNMTVEELSTFIMKHPDIFFDSTPELSNRLGFLRCIKTPEEIQKIEAAQKIADNAYLQLADDIVPKLGITEKQIANRLDFLMRDFGADDVAFKTIAASGPNSAVPHAVPTDRKIREGDFLVLDFGAKLDGYCSDTTRTLAIGKPDAVMEKIYDAVYSANRDSQDRLRAGLTAKSLYALAKHTLNVWGGYDKYFTHSLGHGVGLEVHESPTLSDKSQEVLAENMLVTIEPGVYIPGKFGVRVEDLLVVRSSGSIILSKIPRKLRVIKV